MKKIVFFLLLIAAAVLIAPLACRSQVSDFAVLGLTIKDTLPPVIGHVTTADGNHTTEVRGYWAFNELAKDWQPVGKPLQVGIPKPLLIPPLYDPQRTISRVDTSTPVYVDKNELGRILRVWDGDTYVLQLAEKTTVRLFGVDCPETFSGYVTATQPYGRACTDTVRSLLQGTKVKYKLLGADKYGRTLVTLHVGRKDLALLLLEKGLAWYVENSTDADAPKLTKAQARRYAAAQRKAQRNKVGLWAGYVDAEGETVEAVAPWVWRKINSPKATN